MIIGLSGYARAGKDTAADIIVKEYGFTKVAFADKLREFLYALNPLVGVEGEPYEGGLDYVGVQMVIDRYGWDGYKNQDFAREIRRLLQRLGTEAGRDTLGQNIWVDAALKTEAENIVIPDVRFPNEADAIKERLGDVWRINRFGWGPANDHISEISLDKYKFDDTIWNVGPLEDYRRLIHEAMKRNYE